MVWVEVSIQAGRNNAVSSFLCREYSNCKDIVQSQSKAMTKAEAQAEIYVQSNLSKKIAPVKDIAKEAYRAGWRDALIEAVTEEPISSIEKEALYIVSQAIKDGGLNTDELTNRLKELCF
jgi:hypothetical protein